MKPIKSTLFNMIAALLAVAVLSAAALGYVYQITKEPIARAKDQKTLDAIREVVGTFDNNPFAEKTTIATPDGKSELELYPARENGIVTSVAIKTFSDNGFGGRIELIIGMLMDGTVTGYKVIEQKETPGLGTKIAESKFADQFIGLNSYHDQFKLKKDGGEIDAVTGATTSSRAVIDAVEKAVSTYKKFNAGATGHEE